MAKVFKNIRPARAEQHTGTALYLTPPEVEALIDVLNSVGGDPEKRRGFIDNILGELSRTGHDTEALIGDEARTEGAVYMIDTRRFS